MFKYNMFWIIIGGIILAILGWGSLLISCYKENKKENEPLLNIYK